MTDAELAAQVENSLAPSKQCPMCGATVVLPKRGVYLVCCSTLQTADGKIKVEHEFADDSRLIPVYQ